MSVWARGCTCPQCARTGTPCLDRGIPTPDGPKDLTDELGMFINGRRSIHKVTADDIIAEGTRWGIFERQARATVLSTIKKTGDALSDAAHESMVPEQLVAFVAERAEALRRRHTRADHLSLPRRRPPTTTPQGIHQRPRSRRTRQHRRAALTAATLTRHSAPG